jgi:protease I
MALSGKKIAVVAGPMFEDSELVYPYYRLKEEGAEVCIIGTGEKGDKLKGKHGYKIFTDDSVSKINFKDFAAVVIPGGFSPDYIREDIKVQEFVRAVHATGGAVAAICHGPWVLVSAGLLKDRNCTSYNAIITDVRNAGGKWVDQAVVVDDRIITSRTPDDMGEFCKAIIQVVRK